MKSLAKKKDSIASIPTKAIAKDAYTGKGPADSIGPNRYNPILNQVKNRKPSTCFSASRLQRKVFEATKMADNQFVDVKNPGPAYYADAAKV